MKLCAGLVILGLAACDLLSGADGASVNPIQKVIELISGLQGKVIKDGEAAQKAYEEFADWCKDSSVEKKQEIKDGVAQKESLEAIIAKAESGADEASMRVEQLSGSIATDEQDLKATTLIRQKEHADFEKADKELSDTIATLARAHAVLEKGLASGGGAVFLQQAASGSAPLVAALRALVDTESVASASTIAELTALIQGQRSSAESAETQGESEALASLSVGAPDPAEYTSQSGTILDVIAGMQEKAEQSQSQARAAESTAKHNYDLLKLSLVDRNNQEKKELDRTKQKLAKAKETKATAEGDLEMTIKGLDEDKVVLEKLQHDCMERSTTFQEETSSRKAELEALATAKKVIQASTGGAESRSYSFLQARARADARSGASMALRAGASARDRLRKLAEKVHSAALAQLAARISAELSRQVEAGGRAAVDPFGKVRALIKNMVGKLVAEAEAESEQKEFCDREMAEAEHSRQEKEGAIETLATRIEKGSSMSARLQEEVTTISGNVADLTQGQADMQKLRQEKHADYLVASADLEAGLQGVQKALKVLRDYYATGDDASLVQTGSDEGNPATAGGGIIGLLEVIESDFSKNLAEMKSEEETEQEEFEELTKENSLDKAKKEEDVLHKTREAKALEKKTSEQVNDRDTVQAELDAVQEYYGKLKPQCVTKPDTYEERKQRRAQEIAGLRNALEILEADTEG